MAIARKIFNGVDNPPVVVVTPALKRRTLTPAEGGPVAYQVPGIAFTSGLSMTDHAAASVADGTVKPYAHVVSVDDDLHGAGLNRLAALEDALDLLESHGLGNDYNSYVAFLDDDDLWYPHHLETHLRLLRGDADHRSADVAYSYFDGNKIGEGDKAWDITHKGRVWDPKEPHHITTTITVRASFARAAKDAFAIDPMHPAWSGEDWRFILNLNEAGARFAGTGDVTWHYRVHFGNTSGLPTRGDAA